MLAILDEPEVARWWRRAEWERVDELGADDASRSSLDGRVVGCIQYTEQTDPDYFSAAVDIFISARVFGRGVGARRDAHADPPPRRRRAATIASPSTPRPPTRAPSTSTRSSASGRWGCCVATSALEDGTWRDALLMELLADELR